MAIVAKHISGMLTILRAAMFVDNAEEPLPHSIKLLNRSLKA